MRFTPHAYQERMIAHIMEHPRCALFVDMGLGKTVATLTAVDRLMNETVEVSRVLVIAPKSVALNTWSGECAKWDHLSDFRLSMVMGTAAQREKALEADADIYVTNRDNVSWLVGRYGRHPEQWPFDCVVLDESSSFKNPKSERFRALWKVRNFAPRIIELTGTPAPNGLMDLWSQVKLLDGGDRLGRFIGQFRDLYFHPGARSGAVVYSWLPNAGAGERIAGKISDLCLSLQAGDYLELPDMVDGGMTLQLANISGYRQFEKDCVTEATDGAELSGTTAVALANKLLQYAGGAVYDSEHEWHEVDSTKVDALTDLLGQTHEPVLLFYNYQHERERIMARLPEAVPFRGEPDILHRWNEGGIPVLLCHPASVAFGLNMQAGGRIIVWYSPTWNLELYEQANARLHRQGQTKPVILYHLTCSGTMDEVVLRALKAKGDVQSALVKHIAGITINQSA